MTDYIEIRNWDKFQHADATKRGRDPVWIKAYTRLLSNDDYLNLTGHRRAILHGLWLEYARSGQRIPLDTASITRRLDLKVTHKDLNAILQAGFITYEGDARSADAHRAVTRRSRRGHDAVTTRASHDHNTVTGGDPSTETNDENTNRQDGDVTPSILEKRREEKNKPQLATRAREAVDGWSGPGSNVVSFLDERRRSA